VKAMRLTNCKRCGADTIKREGIKAGKPFMLEYDDNAKRLHRFECASILRSDDSLPSVRCSGRQSPSAGQSFREAL